MPFITSPSILSTKDAAGIIIVPVNRALRFVGATVAQDSPGQTVITIAAGTNTWNETGNVLTGAGPTTPNEFLGSNNDYDVIMVRNSLEIARLASTGFNILGRLKVESKEIIELTVDPTVAAGISANIGSIGLRDNGGIGEAWLKYGAANTAWALLDSNAVDEWMLTGNNLTGAGPTTPNEYFGSNNDYDIITKRNSIERLRHTSTGILLNLTTFNFKFTDNSYVFGETDGGSVLDTSGIGSLAHGRAVNGATISTGQTGANAFGYADAGTAEIQALGQGSLAYGVALTDGVIQANGRGSSASGIADDTDSLIQTNSDGSKAFGNALTGGQIHVDAASEGSQAFGNVQADADIFVSGKGAQAFGSATDLNSQITASASGSLSFGVVTTGAAIITTAGGATAQGVVSGGGAEIRASGTGSHARGSSSSGGTITASGSGATAIGNNSGSNGITASNTASFCGGDTTNGGLLSSGIASFVYGDHITATARFSQSFGLGQVNSSYACMVLGRYGVSTGTAAAWVSTDPLFVLGNGTAIGSPANAFKIDKDGKLHQTAAEKNTAIRLIIGVDTISARTDHTLIFDTTTAGGAVTLPPGENGLFYELTTKGVGAAIYTLTPDGADTLDNAIQSSITTGVVQQIRFFSGVWYAVG